jgi:hypothetical protein
MRHVSFRIFLVVLYYGIIQLLATRFRSHHICITLKNSLKRPFADDLLSNGLNLYLLMEIRYRFDAVPHSEQGQIVTQCFSEILAVSFVLSLFSKWVGLALPNSLEFNILKSNDRLPHHTCPSACRSFRMKVFLSVENQISQITFYDLDNIVSFCHLGWWKSLVPFGILGFDAIVAIWFLILAFQNLNVNS